MSDEQTPPTQVAFHYLKNTAFRVIHCDGIIGGLTPQGYLHFSLYSERPAIPQMSVHALSESGQVAQTPIKQLSRDGIVRELEVDAVMNIEQATAFRDWLTDRIEQHARQHKPKAPGRQV